MRAKHTYILRIYTLPQLMRRALTSQKEMQMPSKSNKHIELFTEFQKTIIQSHMDETKRVSVYSTTDAVRACVMMNALNISAESETDEKQMVDEIGSDILENAKVFADQMKLIPGAPITFHARQ